MEQSSRRLGKTSNCRLGWPSLCGYDWLELRNIHLLCSQHRTCSPGRFLYWHAAWRLTNGSTCNLECYLLGICWWRCKHVPKPRSKQMHLRCRPRAWDQLCGCVSMDSRYELSRQHRHCSVCRSSIMPSRNTYSLSRIQRVHRVSVATLYAKPDLTLVIEPNCLW